VHGLENLEELIIVAAKMCHTLLLMAFGKSNNPLNWADLFLRYFLFKNYDYWHANLIILNQRITRYLDQLGMTSTLDHKVFCRQTLIGGNYALLNTTTFIPNPDYYGWVYYIHTKYV
jgi:hypothetical protein